MIDCFDPHSNRTCYSLNAWKSEFMDLMGQLDTEAFTAAHFATLIGVMCLLPMLPKSTGRGDATTIPLHVVPWQ